MTEEKKTKGVSRRKFLVRGGLGSIGVLALGTYVFRNTIRRAAFNLGETLVPPYSGAGTEANLWFEITKENRVILHSPKVEMGQGTFTGLAQIVADELDISIDQIEVQAAATDTGIVDSVSTGGSLSIAGLWVPLREMAATMREMLKVEAAAKLNIDVSQLSTKDGLISARGKSLTYAEVAAGVENWDLPKTPELRPLDKYKYVGNPIQRIDLKDKVFGSPIFGMDAEMPNMLHATLIRPEHIGGKLRSVDFSKAEAMPGVVKIVSLGDFIGIIAESYAQALSARRVVEIEWDVPKIWSEDAIREVLTVGKGSKMITQKFGSEIESDDSSSFSLEFRSPIGAHAQIEPNGALAFVDGEKASVIISTQVIGVTQKQVAEALDLKLENVNIIPTYLGGGFGRRLNTKHAVEAALLSKAVGRPVKYFFTRKEEFQHDSFRPPTHHIMKGRLNQDGKLENLEHHYASGDVAVNSVIISPVLHKVLGTDIGAMRGGNIMYENIANRRAVQWHTTLPFATSWWRSLGLLANAFAIESFIDEMAIKAGKNPVDFRLQHLSKEENGKRIANVIKGAVEKASYVDKVVNGRAMGIAATIDANTPAAHVVELSIEDNQIIVHKVTCALDCGIAVNPDQVIAQCEGSIIMGMSASLHEKMTIKDGRLYPTIFGPYDMTLMKNAPREIDVVLIKGADVPLPVGEPPMGPIAAAIGNAIRRLSGKRLTELPLQLT